MVSQAAYHAHHADGKRPGHSYSPYMPTNRYTESRVYVPNNDHRGLLGDPLEKAESTPRKRIAVACGRCRQRKIRCSGDKGQNLPCTNCQSAGVAPCLFLRVSSREATIKADFDYNTEISRALANRSSVPLSSNSSYGTAPSNFSPGVSSGSGGSAGDPYRSGPSLYPYNHRTYYNSLPPSPWTPGYNEDCGTPAGYSAPQSCSPYAVVGDQTSQLVPPFTWDGRTPAGPPPPPLTLKVQAPSSAPTLNSTGVSLLPPPLSQSQGQGQPQDTAQAQNVSHCHCHDCVHGQPQVQAQAQTSTVPAGTPRQHMDLGPVPSQAPTQVSSQDHDASQYDHGELVYRPGLTGGSDADVGASSDFHHASTIQSALARTSLECLGRPGECGDNGSNCNNNNTNNNCGNGGSGSGSGSGSGGSSGCETTIQAMQPVPMSRATSHGSMADHGAAMTMSRYKQDMLGSCSSAPSPAPMQSSVQAHLSMAAPPPPSLSSHAHIVNTASPANSPYASGHVSAANSAENLARVNYSTTPVSDGRSSSVTNHSYGPKTVYHEPSLYVSASSVASTPVSERANDGSIFSDQERDVVGTQGPGPVACLDSYTYGPGPSNSTGTGAITTSKILTSSSSSSLHGVYGRQNKKKSSMDGLVKTRSYSPADGPMLPPSHRHSHGHAYMESSRQPGTPVYGSPLPPPPIHTHNDLQAHDVKADSSYDSR